MLILCFLQLYDIQKVVDAVGLSEGLVVGAGAGPHHLVGCNCEVWPVVNTRKRWVHEAGQLGV